MMLEAWRDVTKPDTMVVTMSGINALLNKYDREMVSKIMENICEDIAKQWVEQHGMEVIADLNLDAIRNLVSAKVAQKIGDQF